MMMMMVIIVPLIIIIIIGMSMSIPNTQSRPSNAGGTSKKTRTHTMPHGVGEGEPPQADPPLDHTTTERGEATHITPRGGGGVGGEGPGRTGIICDCLQSEVEFCHPWLVEPWLHKVVRGGVSID